MKAEDLKNSILQLAMQGQLVPQNSNDESASVLLDRIIKSKEQFIKNKKIKKNSKDSIIFKDNGHYYEKIGNKEPICIDDEIPFEIPDTWVWCRHTFLFEISGGSQPPKSKFSDIKKENYIQLYQIRDYGSNPVSVYIPKELAKKVSKKGDIMLARYGASLGKVFWAEDGAYNVAIAKVIFNFEESLFDKEFLFLFYLSNLYQSFLKTCATGRSAQAGFNKKDLNKLFVPIPPLNEQKRIVSQFKLYPTLIERYGVNKEKLDELNLIFPTKLKSSILQEAVQGRLVPQDPNDEPASVLLENIKQEKDKLIKAKKIKKNNKESVIFKEKGHYYERLGKETVCIDEELPFDIPDGWEWIKLGAISFITKLAGFEYSKYISPNIQSKGVPLLKAKNIKNDELIKNFDGYISKSLSDQLFRSKVNKKCILTPYVGASIGNAIIFEGSFEAHLAPNLAKIELYGGVMEEYVFRYIKSPLGYKELTKYIKSTAQPSISMKALRDMLIPLPPLNEQKRIVDKVEQLFDCVDVLINE